MVKGFFAHLLDRRIAIAEASLDGAVPDMPPDEARIVEGAVASRRREFAVGRNCARAAMAALGCAPVALARSENRAPIWPPGLVGSITHTHGWAAAAVARRDQGMASVGIDLEPASELPADLWSTICKPDEIAQVTSQAGITPGLAAHVVFCIKEAAFKCQFPLTGAMLEFDELSVRVDVARSAFVAEYCKGAPRFAPDRLEGRFALAHGHIASAVSLELGDRP